MRKVLLTAAFLGFVGACAHKESAEAAPQAETTGAVTEAPKAEAPEAKPAVKTKKKAKKKTP